MERLRPSFFTPTGPWRSTPGAFLLHPLHFYFGPSTCILKYGNATMQSLSGATSPVEDAADGEVNKPLKPLIQA